MPVARATGWPYILPVMKNHTQPAKPASVLGVVLAGGQSRRFGSDKALAEVDGESLLSLMITALRPYCDTVIVAGRDQAPAPTVADWPRAGLGPLGGLAGALSYAQANGFASVLTCGVDSMGLPDGLLQLLSPPPAILDSQPVIGHWPTRILPQLQDFLADEGKNAMWRFADAVGAARVASSQPPANINRPDDLKALRRDR